MRVRFRGDPDALRASASFSTSGTIHGVVLALVAFGGTGSAPEPPKSLYDTVIRPHEKQIIWYHAPERLPDVRPPAAAGEARPLRANRIAPQRIVSGARDDSRPPQLVYAPPSVELPKPGPLPNLLAVETKAPARPFTPPPPKTIPAPPVELPPADVPSIAPAAAGPNLAPLRRTFAPPPVKSAAVKPPVLPEAEAIATIRDAAPAGPNLAALRRTFTPPAPRTTAKPALTLPEAEAIAIIRDAAPAGPNLAALRRTFTPPPPQTAAKPPVTLPEAEAVAAVRDTAPAGPNLAALRRTFTPPAVKAANRTIPALPEAEAVTGSRDAAPAGANLAPLRRTFTPPPAKTAAAAPPPDLPDLPNAPARIAIVGLDPSRSPIPPAPPPPRDAGFSAGPKLQPDGAAADASASSSAVVVPGVTVRDGPTRQSLLAAIRPTHLPLPPAEPLPPTAPATRVTSAPDPTLAGRTVYTVAIQMPNITSYSGSWLVWFAERQQSTGGTMRPPSPIRKVDPKYIAAAAAEGVQGVVRLGAIIRKDGRVEAVKLLRRLDDRLDRSAMEALAKWQFEPASRDTTPVDVDAVFEIPFRLAPKLSK